MRKEIVLPALAVIGGLGGMGLRRWGLATAFEPETHLPIPAMPATWSLIALSVVMAAVLLLLCRGSQRPYPGGYDEAFSAKGSTVYVVAVVLSAFLLLASALYTAYAFFVVRTTDLVITRLILAALCLVSFVCVLVTAKNNFRAAGKGKYSATLLMPAYTCCVWLIAAYQVRAGDPVQLDYIYELFAIIAVLLALYFTAGFSFEKGRVSQTALFSLLGIYFSIVTLADSHDLGVTLLYGFAIVYLLASSVILLKNAANPEIPTPALTEDRTEELTDEP